MARDEARFESYAGRLGAAGGSVEGIVAALDERDPITLGAAAWLAGRVTSAADDQLGAALDRFLAAADPDDLDLEAEGYAEAALSVALRGDPERAACLLLPMVADDGARAAGQAWLAAGNLAQLGDTSGWPALVHDMTEGIEHVRLMAARQLPAFATLLPDDVDRALERLSSERSELVQNELDDIREVVGVARAAAPS